MKTKKLKKKIIKILNNIYIDDINQIEIIDKIGNSIYIVITKYCDYDEIEDRYRTYTLKNFYDLYVIDIDKNKILDIKEKIYEI